MTYTDPDGNDQTISCAEPTIIKEGTWDDACATSKTGGYLEFLGNVKTIEFQTQNDFGFANIYVDGVLKEEVDLYSEDPGSKVIDVSAWVRGWAERAAAMS